MAGPPGVYFWFLGCPACILLYPYCIPPVSHRRILGIPCIPAVLYRFYISISILQQIHCTPRCMYIPLNPASCSCCRAVGLYPCTRTYLSCI